MSEYAKRTVHGRWSKYSERGEWHSFEVDVDGLQYPLRVDSSKPETIAAMMAVRDKDATFQIAERDGKNINPKSGKPLQGPLRGFGAGRLRGGAYCAGT